MPTNVLAYSHSSGVQKAEIKVLAGLVPSEAMKENVPCHLPASDSPWRSVADRQSVPPPSHSLLCYLSSLLLSLTKDIHH